MHLTSRPRIQSFNTSTHSALEAYSAGRHEAHDARSIGSFADKVQPCRPTRLTQQRLCRASSHEPLAFLVDLKGLDSMECLMPACGSARYESGDGLSREVGLLCLRHTTM